METTMNKPTLTELKLTKKARAKKVLLAKDVLQQLDAQKFHALSGTYFESYDGGSDYHDYADKTPEDLQKELKTTECYVCLRGALFVSSITRYNKVEGKDFFYEDNKTLADLESCSGEYPIDQVAAECRFFTGKELAFMERVFEANLHPEDYDNSKQLNSKLLNLRDETVMRLVMRHVINNDGEINKEKLSREILNTESDLGAGP